MSFSSVWNTVYPIIIAILFFELIIIVHEGGHFAAARLMKIKVNEFSIGMGPKIFSFTKGKTKYSLRWILFGVPWRARMKLLPKQVRFLQKAFPPECSLLLQAR